MWATPFITGQHGTADECLTLYTEAVHKSPGLMDAVPPLFGKRLLCDCPPETPCVADILVAICYDCLMTARLKAREAPGGNHQK
jgi:hypothetical protein